MIKISFFFLQGNQKIKALSRQKNMKTQLSVAHVLVGLGTKTTWLGLEADHVFRHEHGWKSPVFLKK